MTVGAQQLADIDCRQSNTAGAAMDQEGFTCLQIAAHNKRHIGGQIGCRIGRSFDKVHAFRDWSACGS